MGTKEEQMRGGISAMFGDGKGPVPLTREISEGEYAQLERQQIERRKYLTGRRAKDDPRALVTENDMRTTLIVDREQYAVIREIALRECVTIKDLLHAVFQLGIDRYEASHGKVIPRPFNNSADDLFK